MTDDHYFDHDADIGIIGWGKTPEESFIDAAKAMFGLMTDLSLVKPNTAITIEFEESDMELAFVTWLNQLIATAQSNHLVFSEFKLNRNNGHWQGEAQGEKWNQDIERGIEVKGATLTMLSVKKINDKWESKCIVDV